MLLFFITNFLFVFSSLGYLYFFNMFRWDAHLVVTYSANCRGVPLPFLLWCVYMCACVPIYYYYICFRNYFHLILPTAKWRFLVNLLYIIIHGNGIFFLIENNKMCDGLYAWLDFLAGFTLFTFDRIFFIYTYFHVCMLFYDIICFPYSYPATTIILLRSMAVCCIWWEINLNLYFPVLNHKSHLII